MSTAGKVLSVLVALMVLVSIYLLAMVSQLNRSWGKGIETVSEQIEEVGDQIRQARVDAFRSQRQTIAERQITDARMRSLRIIVEDLENRVSTLKEDQLRLELRLQDERDLVARMQQATAAREQEQAELTAALNETNDLRDRLAAENAEKLDRLASLRERLTTLLAENEQLLRRVADRGRDASGAENTD